MAITNPIGQVRFNPNTFMKEVWDGLAWIEIDPNQFTAMPIHTNGIVNTNINASTVVSSRPTISATERELIFDFLKENMRVAEYRDGDGKIETVELQLRVDVGYEWEPIRRAKINRTKI